MCMYILNEQWIDETNKIHVILEILRWRCPPALLNWRHWFQQECVQVHWNDDYHAMLSGGIGGICYQKFQEAGLQKVRLIHEEHGDQVTFITVSSVSISVATGGWRGQLPPNLGQTDPWDLCKTEEIFSRGGGGGGSGVWPMSTLSINMILA